MDNSIKSQKGKPKIEHNGALFLFHMFNKNQTVEFWRCEFFNSNDIKCKARLHRDHDGNIIRQLNEHNCPSGAENVGAKRVITALKRRAAETMEPPAILRGSILQNVPTPVLANIPNKYAMKKVILYYSMKI